MSFITNGHWGNRPALFVDGIAVKTFSNPFAGVIDIHDVTTGLREGRNIVDADGVVRSFDANGALQGTSRIDQLGNIHKFDSRGYFESITYGNSFGVTTVDAWGDFSNTYGNSDDIIENIASLGSFSKGIFG